MNTTQHHTNEFVSCTSQAQAFAFNFAPAEGGRHCQRVIEARLTPVVHNRLHTNPQLLRILPL